MFGVELQMYPNSGSKHSYVKELLKEPVRDAIKSFIMVKLQGSILVRTPYLIAVSTPVCLGRGQSYGMVCGMVYFVFEEGQNNTYKRI